MNPETLLAGTVGAASIMVISVMNAARNRDAPRSGCLHLGPAVAPCFEIRRPLGELLANPTGSRSPGYDQSKCVATRGERRDGA
jgi:hypothetical protein